MPRDDHPSVQLLGHIDLLINRGSGVGIDKQVSGVGEKSDRKQKQRQLPKLRNPAICVTCGHGIPALPNRNKHPSQSRGLHRAVIHDQTQKSISKAETNLIAAKCRSSDSDCQDLNSVFIGRKGFKWQSGEIRSTNGVLLKVKHSH